ncbi:EAL domain-containing response regulator [Ralstonia flatus]|uniref:Sensor histidine kinase RcsC n=1 Tax=Ralstonia flatus TaxID=3058601 RepID=A0AAD2C062_9RALS|nr:EAL domain-containing protein [Ralstonia sp. LMG 32965]MBN6208598.1 EAL domain-containing protein [Ralstonia pickettii]CAJ0878288.1 Sensor histidine kinase RcsC [Ralstonia sp. LMG 32965]CAJ0885750.1 Sensor histidine kinase RcsC [Ralstonia sp. LMG 32965]
MEGFAQLAVLVVDDHPVQRAAARQLLHTLGVQQILTACDGREALYLLQLCHVDLVLCDIDMPGMNGPELMEQMHLRGGQVFPRQAPVWAWVSAMDAPIVESHVSLADAIGLTRTHGVQKPLRPAHVLPLLEEAAARERDRAPAAPVGLPQFSDDELAALIHETPEQIEVVFQPQHDLASNQIAGAEALCRWMHPVHGRVSPAAFVPRLEALGLADGLFFHVLEHCVRVQHALAGYAHPVSIGVNASAQTLSRAGTIDRIEAIVREARIAPATIAIELTEDSPVPDAAQLTIALNRLRLLGHPLAIDDFGVGIATLKLLADLPFTILKIDRSFTAAVDQTSQRGVICRTMIELARSLQLECIAEGVETDAQRQTLRALGCATGQGYLWAAPLSVTAFLAHVQAAA